MHQKTNIHGVSFEISRFQIAVAQKQCIFDPMLVKIKCVWEAVVFFLKNCKQTAEK